MHFLVVAGELPPHIGNKLLERGPALRVPEHDAGAFLLEVEQIHLAAELAVIALLGFFHLLEMECEILLIGEGDAVDALQLRALGIAAPVAARRARDLERAANGTGGCHVRAAAEVEPIALAVDFHVFASRDGVDQFDLEQLSLIFEVGLGLVARPHLAGEG